MVSYLLGQRLLAGTLQSGEDDGLGWSGVIGDTFNIRYYPVVRIVMIAVLSAMILAVDSMMRGIKSGAGMLASLFAGAWYYAMFFGYDVFSNDVAPSMDAMLDRALPPGVASMIAFAIAITALLLPLLFLIILKFAPRAWHGRLHRSR